MRTELATGFLKKIYILRKVGVPTAMSAGRQYKRRKKRGKTNGKEKLSKIAALSLAAAMVLTTKFFL